MNSLSLYLFLILEHCFLLSYIYAANSPQTYTPTDNILLNCGAPTNKTNLDGREWDTDSRLKYILSPDSSKNSITVAIGSEKEPSVEEVPYSTARIFHSKFTYTFPVSSAGQKFLRLYFYPANYSSNSITYDKTKSFFSVNAANHSLLSNFSAFLNLPTDESQQIPNKEYTIVKEFIITVNQSRLFEVAFTPSQNSYAFVNGIEVVSIPAKFYIKGSDDNTVKLVGDDTAGFFCNDSIALETLYRLNVGGYSIPRIHDSGMFRSWITDYPFVNSLGLLPPYEGGPIHYTSETPAYTAPETVYSSARIMENFEADYNLTWIFSVDSGFLYLLRFYFCEYQPEVTEVNQRVFSIFISNKTAEPLADVVKWSGGNGIPVYKDYVVFISNFSDGTKGKQNLWLALHPTNKTIPETLNVILNGLEIFKLSQRGGSLAAVNPRGLYYLSKTECNLFYKPG